MAEGVVLKSNILSFDRSAYIRIRGDRVVVSLRNALNPPAPLLRSPFAYHRQRRPERRVYVPGVGPVADVLQHGALSASARTAFASAFMMRNVDVVSRVAASVSTFQCDTKSARAPA